MSAAMLKRVTELTDSESEPDLPSAVAQRTRAPIAPKPAPVSQEANLKHAGKKRKDLEWSTGRAVKSQDDWKFSAPLMGDLKLKAVEVCSGTGNLSKCLRTLGFHVLSVDVKRFAEHDLTKKANVDYIKNLLDTDSSIRYLHFAPPCCTYSSARWPKVRSVAHPHGFPWLGVRDKVLVLKANSLTKHVFELMSQACSRGIACSVENPGNSVIWHTKAFKGVQLKHAITKVVTDYCQWGEVYRKRTAFCTFSGQDPQFLDGLSRKCPGTCKHQLLSGFGTGGIPTSNGSSEYPMAICTQWAVLVKYSIV